MYFSKTAPLSQVSKPMPYFENQTLAGTESKLRASKSLLPIGIPRKSVFFNTL